jgi:tetratricopeptide (TPR) repeat protein
LAYSYLGGILKQTGDLDGSLAAYQQIIDLSGNNSFPGASAHLDLARVLQEKGELEAAAAEFCRFIKESPIDTEHFVCFAYLHLGNTLEQKGDLANARVAWKQAVKWDQTKIVAKQAREKLKAVS